MTLALDKHFKLVNELAVRYGGLVLKTIGDAFMIRFAPGDDAANFAAEIQIQTLKHPFMVGKEPLRIRIGIATGPVQVKSMRIQGCHILDYFGNATNSASRMESKLSQPDGFAITFTDSTLLDTFALHMGKIVAKHAKQHAIKVEIATQVVKYTSDCAGGRGTTGATHSRSGRMIQHFCKDVEELKGVDALTACNVIITKKR